MNIKKWDLLMIMGAGSFLAAAVLILLGQLDRTWNNLLVLLGLILVGVGASLKMGSD